MIKKIATRVESPKVGGDSTVVLNGIIINFEQVKRERIYDLVFSNETYSEIQNHSFEKVFQKYDGNCYKYVVYGYTNEKDECNRNIPFSSYIETSERDIDLCETINKELSVCGYSLQNYSEYKSTLTPETIPPQKSHTPVFRYLLMGIIAFVVAIILCLTFLFL